jgi:hypothetical protein
LMDPRPVTLSPEQLDACTATQASPGMSFCRAAKVMPDDVGCDDVRRMTE